MSRFYKTRLSKVSNAGPMPRFTGLLSHPKIDGGYFPFRSLTELFVGVWLISCPDVKRVHYEAGSFTFPTPGGKPRKHWPDFRCVLDGGEVEWINAKNSRLNTSESQRDALDVFDAFCAESDRRHRVVYYDDLAREGELDTLTLLLPYSRLAYAPGALARAEERLAGLGATFVEKWQQRAREAQVPVDVVYHLLFHRRLPLLFRPMVSTELLKCRA